MWVFIISINQLGLKNKLGKKPLFHLTKGTGAFQYNNKKGGINWYCYFINILIPKLISFVIKY